MLLLKSIPCHTCSNMSAVRDAVTSKMHYFNLLMSLGKGGTYTKSLTCLRIKKSYAARSRDLVGHFTKVESTCLSQPIQQFGRCSFRCSCKAVWKCRDTPSCWKKLSQFLYQTRYIMYFLSHSKIYISESVHFFCEDLFIKKNLNSDMLHSWIMKFTLTGLRQNTHFLSFPLYQSDVSRQRIGDLSLLVPHLQTVRTRPCLCRHYLHVETADDTDYCCMHW